MSSWRRALRGLCLYLGHMLYQSQGNIALCLLFASDDFYSLLDFSFLLLFSSKYGLKPRIILGLVEEFLGKGVIWRLVLVDDVVLCFLWEGYTSLQGARCLLGSCHCC